MQGFEFVPNKNQLVYEHVFPKNSWNSLRKIDSKNWLYHTDSFLNRNAYDYLAEDVLFKSLRKGANFIQRVEIKPDKLRVVRTLGASTALRNPAPDFLQEYLDEDEILGGTAIRYAQYGLNLREFLAESFKSERDNKLNIDLNTLLKPVMSSLKNIVVPYVGILSKDNNPRGVLFFSNTNNNRETWIVKSKAKTSPLRRIYLLHT